MPKNFFYFLSLFFLFSFSGKDLNRLLSDELPFSCGEKITYRLMYKGFKVGQAELIFHGQRKLNKKEVYFVTFNTATVYFKDLERIFAEKESFLPLRVERRIRTLISAPTLISEEYDQDNFQIKIRKKTLFSSKNFIIKKNSPIHNAILLSYYYRKKKRFSPQEVFQVNLPTRSFKLAFKGKQKVPTPLGEFSAYLFEADNSSFKFWLRDDEKRTPLKIEVPKLLGYSLVIESIEEGK